MSRLTKVGVILALMLPFYADAQVGPSPAPESAAVRKRNRQMCEVLVTSNLLLAEAAADPLKKSEAYPILVRALESEIRSAARDQDAPRVAEVGQHLHKLVEEGFRPTWSSARRAIPKFTRDEPRLLAARDQAVRAIGGVESALGGDSATARDPLVRRMLDGLSAARQELDKAGE